MLPNAYEIHRRHVQRAAQCTARAAYWREEARWALSPTKAAAMVAHAELLETMAVQAAIMAELS